MNEQIVYKNIDEFYEMFGLSEKKVERNIIRYMQNKDDILLLRFPNNMGISGIVMRKKDRNKDYKCIYLNTNEPLGRQNFSFVHELYHIYFEEAPRQVCLENDRNKNEIEKRAEIFASNILIPRLQLLIKLKEYRYTNSKDLSIESVFNLQRYFKTSFQAIVYAIESLNDDSRYSQYTHLVPKVGNNLKKYYNKWSDLELLTAKKDPGNNFNAPTKEFEFPEDFKKDIINNYKDNLISLEDASTLFEFFNEKFIG